MAIPDEMCRYVVLCDENCGFAGGSAVFLAMRTILWLEWAETVTLLYPFGKVGQNRQGVCSG